MVSEKKVIEQCECISQPIEYILRELTEIRIDITVVLEELIKFYYKNGRHRYSLVSKFILEKNINNDSKMEVILTNIAILEDYINLNVNFIEDKISELNLEKKDFNYEKFSQCFRKLKDHLELEVLRDSKLKNDQNSFIKRQTNELNSSIEQTKKNFLQRTEKLEEKLNTGFISILGIFAAIMIAFFGGLNVLGNIFTLIGNKNVSEMRIIIFSCLSGLIIFNIIFMFLYILGKLVGKNIGGICDENLIKKHKNSKFFKFYYLSKIAKARYPIFYYFNFLMILIMILGILYNIIFIIN